jgi:hypothetical protein
MRIAATLVFVALCLHALAGAASAVPIAPVNVPVFAEQVVAARNNQGLPFLVVDKVQARVWIFTGLGAMLGSSPVLLGLAIGDTSVPDIGERKLSNIRPEERITPAGRFPSTLGRNLQGQEVLWVDYDGGVSMHRFVRGQPSERRAERLATPTPTDNRVSYGCINVPAAFFNALVLPTVRQNGSIVYVLPETRPMNQLFGFLPGSSVR